MKWPRAVLVRDGGGVLAALIGTVGIALTALLFWRAVL